MSRTRISRVEVFRAESPLSRPIADSTHQLEEISFLVLRLHLAEGGWGESYLLAFHYSPQGILGALRDATPLLEGIEVWETVRFKVLAEQEMEYFGQTGLQRWALSAINIAMWDAWARYLDQPVWKLLGVCRTSVTVYGSGGWLSYSLEELLEEATGYCRRGFPAVKIKVGSRDPQIDIERLRKVREAVGNPVRIMMDANQGLDYGRALDLAVAVRPYGITWFEEPLPHTDFAGYAELRRQTGLSLAMGEREFDTTALRELVGRSALDLWQPDILRLGGVEAWRESAAFAHIHHLPVLPHYYKEYDVPLLTTIPNAHGAEWFDWVDGIIDKQLPLDQGRTQPLPGPGWGFRFLDSHLEPVFSIDLLP